MSFTPPSTPPTLRRDTAPVAGTVGRLDAEESFGAHRRRRELAVVHPTGSLALVNTQWIDSEQSVYGVPGVWAPLPEGLSGLRVQAVASEGIIVDGELVDGTAIVRGKDADRPGEVSFSETVCGSVIANELGSYALRVWDADAEGIREFGSIDAFPYNPEWVIAADFVANADGSTVGFEHLNDNGATSEVPVPGEIVFAKDGVDYRLTAFLAGQILRLVFADSTNGDTTYSVGRFLYSVPAADGSLILDFNRAVLPPCAFSYNFNCPLPPKQNRFATPIEAGEKNVLTQDGNLLHG